MKNYKNIVIDFYKKSEKYIVCCLFGFLFGMIVSMVCVSTYYKNLIIENKDAIRIENVRHFIEHPSMYKLDTLYRKSNDTLFIDTIKINYK